MGAQPARLAQRCALRPSAARPSHPSGGAPRGGRATRGHPRGAVPHLAAPSRSSADAGRAPAGSVVSMDPDETLRRLRHWFASREWVEMSEEPGWEGLDDIRETFNNLDTWLSRGGYLPLAWRRVAEAPKKEASSD